jgi:hypothetical protein
MQSDQGMYGIPARRNPPRSEAILYGDSGAGSTNTLNRNFSTVSVSGSGLVVTTSPVFGASVKVIQPGVYSILWSGCRFTATDEMLITRNVIGAPAGVSAYSTQLLCYFSNSTVTSHVCGSVTVFLNADDIIRVATAGASRTASSADTQSFRVTQVSV